MVWDDELTTLAEKVTALFGERAVTEAYVRALTAAPEASPEAAADFIILDRDTSETKYVDGVQSAAALKAELRRLLTAH